MKYDIILSGVGGQGVLSLAAVIAEAALGDNFYVRQSEVHGMAQRGGAVLSHLRLSDKPIHSDLVARGTADLILSMEPMESLRYTDYLAPEGIIVTDANPFINISDYPEIDGILAKVKGVTGSRIVDAESLAREAGSVKAKNIVIVGAASSRLPIGKEAIHAAIKRLFGRKGDAVVKMNYKAFDLGAAFV